MHLAVRLQLQLHYINRAIWSCPAFLDPLGLHTILKRPRTRIKRTGPDLHLTDSIKPVSKPVRVLARVSGRHGFWLTSEALLCYCAGVLCSLVKILTDNVLNTYQLTVVSFSLFLVTLTLKYLFSWDSLISWDLHYHSLESISQWAAAVQYVVLGVVSLSSLLLSWPPASFCNTMLNYLTTSWSHHIAVTSMKQTHTQLYSETHKTQMQTVKFQCRALPFSLCVFTVLATSGQVEWATPHVLFFMICFLAHTQTSVVKK